MNREDTRNFVLCPGGHFISLIWQVGMTTPHLEQKTLLFGCMSPNVVFRDIGADELSPGFTFCRGLRRVYCYPFIMSHRW